MASRVTWSGHALRDLENIAEYIAADSPRYAAAVVKKIVTQARMLGRFPRSGRKVPEFEDPNLREVVVYSYRVIYRLMSEEILIAAVVHGRRSLE